MRSSIIIEASHAETLRKMYTTAKPRKFANNPFVATDLLRQQPNSPERIRKNSNTCIEEVYEALGITLQFPLTQNRVFRH